MISHGELSAWKSAMQVPLSGKPRTKAGREWQRLGEQLREAIEALGKVETDQRELDSRITEREENLRSVLAAGELSPDPREQKAARDRAVELEAELTELRRPRNFERERDVAERVCRSKARDLAEFLRGNAAELFEGEVAPVAREARNALAKWAANGPERELSEYERAQRLSMPLLIALGLNGQDLPPSDFAGIRQAIEDMRAGGIPYPLPRSFFDEAGEPRVPEGV